MRNHQKRIFIISVPRFEPVESSVGLFQVVGDQLQEL
jgi:hypothetical protein